MKFRLFILFIAITGFQCTSAQQEIDEQYVSKIVKTLSADDMEGRQAFTEGADKAAQFLAGEFKAMGLSYLLGADSYLQKFNMYELAVSSASVTINGQEAGADDVFAIVDQEEINWTSTDDIEVIAVNAEGRLPDAYGQAKSTKGDVLVLIDPSHKDMYGRYRDYFSQGSRKFELGQENNIVFALTDQLEVESLDINVTSTVAEKGLANVAAMIEGNRKDEIVLFSGHYDHIGYQKTVEGDSIANGANDDASGTAAVMALAKYFSGTKPERTIYFVAFTAEEMGGYGSQYFSKQLDPDNIVAMFNIEMIGKPAVEGPNTAWITGFDKSDFGSLLQKSVEDTEYEFYADPYPDQNLFYRSDNATLARLGVPAHSISTTPIDVDKDYHQVTDEYETLDVTHMTNTVKAIAKGAEGIVSGKDTPTRVDKADVE